MHLFTHKLKHARPHGSNLLNVALNSSAHMEINMTVAISGGKGEFMYAAETLTALSV